MTVTVATWVRRTNDFRLSGSRVVHTTESAMKFLIDRRGYSVDAAANLLRDAKYAA